MVVGPSGTGKTTMCECLAAALTELGTKHVLWRMNPKAITAPQMFGKMDTTTGRSSAATIHGLFEAMLHEGQTPSHHFAIVCRR